MSNGVHDRIGGVTFAKLYPNTAELFRGAFVADQVAATSGSIDWQVVAPVPLVPAWLARLFGKPYVKGDREFRGVYVRHPRYPVLPRRILYATVAPLIALTARRAFAVACAAVNASFVHVHDLYPSGGAAWRLCRRARLPYVVTVHGLDLYSNLGNPRWRREITRCARDAEAVICVSRSLADDVVVSLDVDADKVVVVPNTYDTNRFHLVERARDDGPVRLLSVGRLSPEKGHAILLRAYAQVLAHRPDLTLTLVGDGSERQVLERLAADLGIADKVVFAGLLTDEPVAQAMAEADIFVLPSLSEGFGVVLIEAMATGLPVVATRSGGPETIVEPETGVLVAADSVAALAEGLGSALARLPEFDAEHIAARAAARYSPGAVGSRLIGIYRDVLDKRPVQGSIGGGGE